MSLYRRQSTRDLDESYEGLRGRADAALDPSTHAHAQARSVRGYSSNASASSSSGSSLSSNRALRCSCDMTRLEYLLSSLALRLRRTCDA